MSENQQYPTPQNPARDCHKIGLVRCISLWQPWASLMACGAKHLETRGWDTKVRGEIHIHASKTRKGLALLHDAPLAKLEAIERALNLKIGRWASELPFGAIVARGDLVATERAETALRSWPDQEPFGDFTPGRFAHRYENITELVPSPWKGAQGFFFARRPSLCRDLVRSFWAPCNMVIKRSGVRICNNRNCMNPATVAFEQDKAVWLACDSCTPEEVENLTKLRFSENAEVSRGRSTPDPESE